MKILIQFSFVLLLTIHSNQAFGQNCSTVSRTRVKNTETETIGNSINSKDFYTLLIEKTIYKLDSAKSPIYSIELVAASRVLLTDSIINTKGTFELLLLDNSVVTISNVTYKNNPLGYCCSLGFSAELDQEKITTLSKSPIVTLKVKGINLTTTFAPKRQKQQQTICWCLLNK